MRTGLYLLIILSLFSACNQNLDKDRKNKNLKDNGITEDAKLFSVSDFKGYRVLSIRTKEGTLRDSYYLVEKMEKVPEDIKNKNIIRTPVTDIVCLSTTHVAFVDALGETDKIRGVSGKDYIYNENLKKRMIKEEVRDVGYENSLDFELLLQIKPDVVTVYDINGTISPVINKIKKFNIPVIQINEYLESSALSQAEWIKFFGELFNKRKEAKVKYDKIKYEYNKLKKNTDTVIHKPSVLLNMPWKGAWYIPGGKSNIAKLISDAGGNYVWKENSETHNTPLNIEEVYLRAKNADIWLNPGQAGSVKEINYADKRLTTFKAYKNGMIYNRNKRVNSRGGNDVMESGIVRPDLILKDLIKILHPELLPEHELYYYKKIK